MTELKNQISLGNAIQIVVLILGLGAAWATMDTRSAATEATLNTTRADFQNMESRVRALETSTAAADARNEERFNTILATLGRIDARLERMEKKP